MNRLAALCVVGDVPTRSLLLRALTDGYSYEETSFPVPYRFYDVQVMQIEADDTETRDRALAYLAVVHPANLIVGAARYAMPDWLSGLNQLGYAVERTSVSTPVLESAVARLFPRL